MTNNLTSYIINNLMADFLTLLPDLTLLSTLLVKQLHDQQVKAYSIHKNT